MTQSNLRFSVVGPAAGAAGIPSAAVGLSRSLATATTSATERGTKAISSLFGSLAGFAGGMSSAAGTPICREHLSNL